MKLSKNFRVSPKVSIDWSGKTEVHQFQMPKDMLAIATHKKFPQTN